MTDHYMPIKQKTKTLVDSGQTQFGFVDQKGRVCGYTWTISNVVVELPAEGEAFAYRIPASTPLTSVEVWGSPSRDLKLYGPAFNYASFASLADAQKNVAKRISAARKRDAKKFAAYNA